MTSVARLMRPRGIHGSRKDCRTSTWYGVFTVDGRHEPTCPRLSSDRGDAAGWSSLSETPFQSLTILSRGRLLGREDGRSSAFSDGAFVAVALGLRSPPPSPRPTTSTHNHPKTAPHPPPPPNAPPTTTNQTPSPPPPPPTTHTIPTPSPNKGLPSKNTHLLALRTSVNEKKLHSSAE